MKAVQLSAQGLSSMNQNIKHNYSGDGVSRADA